MRITPIPSPSQSSGIAQQETPDQQHNGRFGQRASVPQPPHPAIAASADQSAPVASLYLPPVERPAMPVEQATSSSDSSMFEIGYELPSKMAFYPYSTLSVRHFSLLEHIKLKRAVTEQRLRHQIDAMSNSQDHSAYDMTVGDFQFLMYWHRLNDFKRTPYAVTWYCSDPDHMVRTEAAYQVPAFDKTTFSDGYAELTPEEQSIRKLRYEKAFSKLAPESIENVLMMQKSNMEVVYLDIDKCAAFQDEFLADYGIHLFPPTTRDMVYAAEEDEIDADLAGFNRYAGLLDPYKHGDSLGERRHWLIQYIKKNPHLGLDIVHEFEKWVRICDHGVREGVNVTCKECGHKREISLRIDPYTFFPSL